MNRLDKFMKFLNTHKNNQSRVWAMCQVVLKLATECVDEAEKYNLTDKSFYLDFEDSLNCLSVKDHSKNPSIDKRQAEEFSANVYSFINNKPKGDED